MKVHYDGVTVQIADPVYLPQLLALDQQGNKDGEVTEDHRILVEKEGGLEWIAVKDLKEGDLLVSEEGEVLEYNRQATRIEEGAFNVYNFSFSEDGVEALIPNYLVSTDGEHWVIAHNFK